MAEMIKIKGKTLELDGQGYLVNPEQWDIDVANYFAGVEGIHMTEPHWEVVKFLRSYSKEYRKAPMIKVLAKELGDKLGPDKGNARYLQELYPCGPAVQACKIAGLPASTGCV